LPLELISDKAMDIANKSDKYKTNLSSKKTFLLKLRTKIERQIEAKKIKEANLLVLKISYPIKFIKRHVTLTATKSVRSINFTLSPLSVSLEFNYSAFPILFIINSDTICGFIVQSTKIT